MQKYFISIYLLLFPYWIGAQITSAGIEGIIKDEQGEMLFGANIIVQHLPTGIQYGTTTEDGYYVLPNLKTGGPYTIEVSYLGYETLSQNNVYLELGVQKQLDFELHAQANQLDEVLVVFDRNDLFESDKQGTSTNVGKQQIEELPSLNRSLQDMTRLNPQGNANTFAGTNYRFNNLSIDGASNNDVLGFQEPASGAGGATASGTPGALAGTQPISLDAIEEVQVAIAPFDVRLGNFTGANLNAVTRSGTNQVQGTIYTFGRNQILTGKSIDESRQKIESFYDYQLGASLGAPILKNKLFVFGNYERSRRSEPIVGIEGTNIPTDVATSVRNHLIESYNYDAGSIEATNIERNSDKAFLRLDYHLSKKHQLSLRHNIVVAAADNLERGGNVFKFSTQAFRHHSTTNSTVAELKSHFKNNISNHLIVGYNQVEDRRDYEQPVFPHIEIKYNTANTIWLGSYREASIYGLTLGTSQITNNLNIYKKKHTLTLGTSNEFYNIQYRFLTAWNGRWEYRSLDDFFADQPSRIRGVYNYGDNSFEFNRDNPSADFSVFLLSAYAQDEFRPSDRLTLTAGLRVDMQIQPDKVPLNPDVINTPEFAHFDNQFGGVPILNPRFGFKYNLANKEVSTKKQMRGGLGLFTGKVPFAWYAYGHYISGARYGNIDVRPSDSVAIETDISQLQNLQPGLTEVNLIDNNFKLPQVLRASLAYDLQLQNDWQITIEGVYSKTLQGIQFQSINLKEETTALDGADNRQYYSAENRKINDKFTNVFLLTNTQKGYQYNLTASINKRFDWGLNWTMAYTYGESKDISNGVRNSMAANFSVNQAVFSNNPNLAFSNFDLRHRILGVLEYQQQWSPKHFTYINSIFNGQSGGPFSFTVEGDLDNDTSSRNDLFYVPSSSDEITFSDILDENGLVLVSAEEQWQQLDKYIENDKYLSTRRGQYAERNGARTPWNYNIDLRIAHRFSFQKEQSIELSLDIFNFLNLLHYQWGKQHFVPNISNLTYQLIQLDGIENNMPIYQFDNPQGTPWQIDPLNSRWQAQLGLRYRF